MRARAIAAALCGVVTLILPAAAAGKTVEFHKLSQTFNGADAVGAPHPFETGSLLGVAVDDVSHNVYVGTPNNVYKFNAMGKSQPFSALTPNTALPDGLISNFTPYLTVDNSGGASQSEIFVGNSTEPVLVFKPSGEELKGKFPIRTHDRQRCGVAVDAKGNIWLEERDNTAVELNPQGELTGKEVKLATPDPFESVCKIEIDSEGNFYAVSGRVEKFAPDGTFLRYVDEGFEGVGNVAVDRTTGDVYVDTNEEIDHYNPKGEFIESFGTFEYSGGVAVDSTTHEVYALSNGENTFAQTFESTGVANVPRATTEGSTGVKRTVATLHGTLNAEGIETTGCNFELRPYNQARVEPFKAVPCVEGSKFTGGSDRVVSAVATGLMPAQEYEFRLAAKNRQGPGFGVINTFTTADAVKGVIEEEVTDIGRTHATFHASFEPDGLATKYYFTYYANGEFHQIPTTPASGGSGPGRVYVSEEATDLTPGETPDGTEYQVTFYAENETGRTSSFRSFRTLPAVLDVVTLPATPETATTATLNGSFKVDGLDTHYYFEWGVTEGYGNYAPAAPPGVDASSSPGDREVSATLSGLELGREYHYRLVASNETYGVTLGADETFVVAAEPTIADDRATEINTDTAVLAATINPSGRETAYFWEYGTEDCAVSVCRRTATKTLKAVSVGVPTATVIEGLTPGTVYFFRLRTENSLGKVAGRDQFFRTFSLESGADPCPNVLERKQTGAAATAHCRAYELVSAAETDGYDVDSSLVASSEPAPGFPFAENRVLYTLRFGGVTGLGNPPNRGGDPYLAVRGPEGWTTSYVGLDASSTPSALPFSSRLLEADQGLNSFAFGGAGTCEPCFSDGTQNIPLRLADGTLVKGMAGADDPAGAEAPAGRIGKRFSADGQSFLFGSTERFEPAGNEGSLTIYERNLTTGRTQVVSTNPDGTTMSGAGEIAELDVSADGSRVLIGRKVGEDAAGNPLYDLYLHVGANSKSVPIAAPAGGAGFAGMSADGSEVYFTAAGKLADDTDSGADLFRADVAPGTATITRVSSGAGAGNSDACSPVEGKAGNHWNAPGATSIASCGVVAVAGGGGVAATSGTVYFLSPEKLAASGPVADQPNLYAAAPGSPPVFVATLSPKDPVVVDGVEAAAERETADFQTTRGGQFAAFDSFAPLTGVTTAAHEEIYRSELGGMPACVSCLPTNGAPISDTRLTSRGTNLTEEGRVLFTSKEQLVLRDTNQVDDAYEWDEGRVTLISTGLDTNNSALLTVSADGADAFFFTRQVLAPQDQNGGTMKIYDAREGGGFLYNPPPAPCVASDECHGPGTSSAPPPPIKTIEGTGTRQPTKHRCGKTRVKRHGKCVRKRRRGHDKNGKASGHAGAGKRHG